MDREGLDERQGEVVRALVGGGRVPEGFDWQAIQRTSQSLLAKRREAVRARCQPLASSLGTHFVPLFDAYARAQPHEEGEDDLDRFLAYVEGSSDVPDEAMRVILGRKWRWWRPILWCRSKKTGRVIWVCRKRL